MQVRELKVSGAFEITLHRFPDERGSFLEWFQQSAVEEAVGHKLDLAQANCSVSARGVLRGIHFSDVPPGQAKYVTCVRGAVLDVAVDIRVGSPTFGQWDSVLLDTTDNRAIYLSEGLGHAFLSLEDNSTVVYLCSSSYAPEREHAIHPLDPALGIAWPSDLEPVLSEKDATAPSLADALSDGLLPTFLHSSKYLRDVLQ
ncbi:MAG: dTDP-4-dehydrorhamnose 3,5-epimerase [Actinomycetes bacterium]